MAHWSRSTFRNIFQKIETLEDTMKEKEIRLYISPTTTNWVKLNKVEVNPKKLFKIEEEFQK